MRSALLEFLRIDGPGSFREVPIEPAGCTVIGCPFTKTMVSRTESYPLGGPKSTEIITITNFTLQNSLKRK